jgi:para-aminobenzoate synthetase component 1
MAQRTPVIRQEIDWRSPVAAFAPLARRAGSVLLHSGACAKAARWSFVVADPTTIIESRRGETFVDGAVRSASPFEILSKLHDERRLGESIEGNPPLSSGLVGYAGYECAQLVEPRVRAHTSPFGLHDFRFGAYDAIAAFDVVERRAFVAGRNAGAVERLVASLGEGPAQQAKGPFLSPLVAGNFSPGAYRAAVGAIVRRIGDGDLFQANISQRLVATLLDGADPYALFAAAAAESSAAFGAYFGIGESALISFSPERFFSVSQEMGGATILAEPIKGTRPRGKNAQEDARLLAELIADPKDRAENVMIADLTRNDLSRLCADHSIRELAICEPATHATVHHLVSRIAGTLLTGATAATALASIFPCGSVTGAPKIEAMNAIADIEGTGRGPYCGAIGYIDDGGGADFSVAIRLAVVEGGKVSVPVGGGVTLRSDPEREYEETIDKARWLSPFCAGDAG